MGDKKMTPLNPLARIARLINTTPTTHGQICKRETWGQVWKALDMLQINSLCLLHGWPIVPLLR